MLQYLASELFILFPQIKHILIFEISNGAKLVSIVAEMISYLDSVLLPFDFCNKASLVKLGHPLSISKESFLL